MCRFQGQSFDVRFYAIRRICCRGRTVRLDLPRSAPALHRVQFFEPTPVDGPDAPGQTTNFYRWRLVPCSMRSAIIHLRGRTALLSSRSHASRARSFSISRNTGLQLDACLRAMSSYELAAHRARKCPRTAIILACPANAVALLIGRRSINAGLPPRLLQLVSELVFRP